MFDPYCGKCGGSNLPPTFKASQYGSIESHGISIGASGPMWFQLRQLGGHATRVFWTTQNVAISMLQDASAGKVLWLDWWDGAKFVPLAVSNNRSVSYL